MNVHSASMLIYLMFVLKHKCKQPEIFVFFRKPAVPIVNANYTTGKPYIIPVRKRSEKKIDYQKHWNHWYCSAVYEHR